MSYAVEAAPAAALAEAKPPPKNELTETLDRIDPSLRAMVKLLALCGYCTTPSDQAKTAMKILIGRGVGLDDISAWRNVILQPNGTPTFSAVAMAEMVRKSGKYDYAYTHDPKDGACTVEFFDIRGGGRRSIGRSAFGPKEAQEAGLASKETFKKFPRNMYFARAMSNGCKWACPDVFSGYQPYLPDEIPGSEYETDAETLDVVKVRGVTPAVRRPPTVRKSPVDSLTGAEWEHVLAAARKAGFDDEALCNHVGASPPQWTAADCDDVRELIEQKTRAFGQPAAG